MPINIVPTGRFLGFGEGGRRIYAELVRKYQAKVAEELIHAVEDKFPGIKDVDIMPMAGPIPVYTLQFDLESADFDEVAGFVAKINNAFTRLN
jgi:hypothetical protein